VICGVMKGASTCGHTVHSYDRLQSALKSCFFFSLHSRGRVRQGSSARRRQASAFCAPVNRGGRPHMLPASLCPAAAFGCAGADKVTLDVRQCAQHVLAAASSFGMFQRAASCRVVGERLDSTLSSHLLVGGIPRVPMSAAVAPEQRVKPAPRLSTRIRFRLSP
jgi:hypothetical protein